MSPKVYIVEKDRLIAQALVVVLRKMGFTVSLAEFDAHRFSLSDLLDFKPDYLVIDEDSLNSYSLIDLMSASHLNMSVLVLQPSSDEKRLLSHRKSGVVAVFDKSAHSMGELAERIGRSLNNFIKNEKQKD